MKNPILSALGLGLAGALAFAQGLWAAGPAARGPRVSGRSRLAAGPFQEPVLPSALKAPGALPLEDVALPASAIEPDAGGTQAPAAPSEPGAPESGPSRELARMADGPERGAGGGAAQAAAARFDGKSGPGGYVRAGDEAPPEDGAELAAASSPSEILDLSFDPALGDGLKKSAVFTAIRLLNTRGKAWYWGKYEKGARVRVLVRNKTRFVSRIESARTKAIGKSDDPAVPVLTKKDLEGYFSRAVLRRNPLNKLRERLIAKLSEYGARVNLHSLVRVMRLLPFKAARALEDNERRDPEAKSGPRNPVSVPSGLKSLRDHLPKLVLLDLRLFNDSVPVALVDDMGKLLKAGVHFALITDKPVRGPGSIQEFLARGLGGPAHDQRDHLVRFMLSVLADGGNAAMTFDHNRLEFMASARFNALDIETMQLAGRKAGAAEIESRTPDRLVMTLPEGAEPTAFIRRFEENLARLGMASSRYRLQVGLVGGRLKAVARPGGLSEGIESLLKGLREREGLFVDNEDLLVVSKDEELLQATPGAVQAARYAPGMEGEYLAEASLAALLGDYREMGPGDLAASASMIKQVVENKESYGPRAETIHTLIGHVIHSAFNWAVWVKRNARAWPSLDQVVEEAQARWERGAVKEKRSMLRQPGDSMADYRGLMITRLGKMYEHLTPLIEKYPIIFGTELPHLMTMQRYAKGAVPLDRNIARATFDLMLGRETPEGLDVVVIDLKTGATQDLERVKKDFQYQLYDLVARRLKTLPVPYNVEGRPARVARVSVGFLYPHGLTQPELRDEDRARFEVKTLPGAFDKLRKQFHIEVPKPARPKKTSSRPPVSKKRRAARKKA